MEHHRQHAKGSTELVFQGSKLLAAGNAFQRYRPNYESLVDADGDTSRRSSSWHGRCPGPTRSAPNRLGHDDQQADARKPA